jgi:chemotaxis methyl-accepting protein methylase
LLRESVLGQLRSLLSMLSQKDSGELVEKLLIAFLSNFSVALRKPQVGHFFAEEAAIV